MVGATQDLLQSIQHLIMIFNAYQSIEVILIQNTMNYVF